MRRIHLVLITMALILAVSACNSNPNHNQQSSQKPEWALVVHGGAGGDKGKGGTQMPERYQQAYKDSLKQAIAIGSALLEKGGTALEAVQAVVMYMENCPLFNAGKGAVMNSECYHELDAAIMDGRDLNAGSVAGVRDVKNPILLAREVMENSPHVFLIGEGASSFAKQRGLEIVENSYFSTERSAAECEEIRTKQKQGKPLGTVGCVALDKNGDLAAATSTGGLSGKRWGRVGDVPIVGAGTYADNESVAVSGTGHGELWIRRVVGYDISALMKYKGLSVEEAAKEVIWNKIDKMDGDGGGVICISKNGDIAMEFDTQSMFRAYAKSNGETDALIY